MIEIGDPRYNAYPGHPLFHCPVEILEVARRVMQGAALEGDVDRDTYEQIGDSVVSALRTAGYIQDGNAPSAITRLRQEYEALVGHSTAVFEENQRLHGSLGMVRRRLAMMAYKQLPDLASAASELWEEISHD